MGIWKKGPGNPILRAIPGTWKNDRVSSVTVAFKDGACYFYYDGGYGSWWNGVPGHSAIGVQTCPEHLFDGKTFEDFLDNPVLTHGRFCDFDRIGLQSPRVHLIDGQFYLYYVGTSYQSFIPGTCPLWTYGIGLATSPDGINFTKVSHGPIVPVTPDSRDGTPKLFFRDGRWNLLTGHHQIGKGIAVALRTSDDPKQFDGLPEIVFLPGPEGSSDGYSIAAPAFMQDDDGYYYMLYGGGRHLDYPDAVGLARSADLRNWERHPDNPIIRRGEPGEWDDGAIWITEFIKVKDIYYAWYEGRSAGRDREESYSPGATKQIGLLTLQGNLWD